MSPAHPAEAPLRRTNINFFQSDIDYLQAKFGNGWQGQIRDQIHRWVQVLKTNERKPTIGDILDAE